MSDAVELIELRTSRRSEMVEITGDVARVLRRSGVSDGAAIIQSLHTTGGITINENADPDVTHDMTEKLDRLFPREEAFFRHAEGNSDSHLKTSYVGPSVTVIVQDGEMVLGTWQGIYFCEWDGPRSRRVAVQILGT